MHDEPIAQLVDDRFNARWEMKGTVVSMQSKEESKLKLTKARTTLVLIFMTSECCD